METNAAARKYMGFLRGLHKQLQSLTTFEAGGVERHMVEVAPEDDKVTNWLVTLSYPPPEEGTTYLDSRETPGTATVKLRIKLSPNDPSQPPVMQVLEPRVEVEGGTELVIEGAICARDLGEEKWDPSDKFLASFLMKLYTRLDPSCPEVKHLLDQDSYKQEDYDRGQSIIFNSHREWRVPPDQQDTDESLRLADFERRVKESLEFGDLRRVLLVEALQLAGLPPSTLTPATAALLSRSARWVGLESMSRRALEGRPEGDPPPEVPLAAEIDQKLLEDGGVREEVQSHLLLPLRMNAALKSEAEEQWRKEEGEARGRVFLSIDDAIYSGLLRDGDTIDVYNGGIEHPHTWNGGDLHYQLCIRAWKTRAQDSPERVSNRQRQTKSPKDLPSPPKQTSTRNASGRGRSPPAPLPGIPVETGKPECNTPVLRVFSTVRNFNALTFKGLEIQRMQGYDLLLAMADLSLEGCRLTNLPEVTQGTAHAITATSPLRMRLADCFFSKGFQEAVSFNSGRETPLLEGDAPEPDDESWGHFEARGLEFDEETQCIGLYGVGFTVGHLDNKGQGRLLLSSLAAGTLEGVFATAGLSAVQCSTNSRVTIREASFTGALEVLKSSQVEVVGGCTVVCNANSHALWCGEDSTLSLTDSHITGRCYASNSAVASLSGCVVTGTDLFCIEAVTKGEWILKECVIIGSVTGEGGKINLTDCVVDGWNPVSAREKGSLVATRCILLPSPHPEREMRVAVTSQGSDVQLHSTFLGVKEVGFCTELESRLGGTVTVEGCGVIGDNHPNYQAATGVSAEGDAGRLIFKTPLTYGVEFPARVRVAERLLPLAKPPQGKKQRRCGAWSALEQLGDP